MIEIKIKITQMQSEFLKSMSSSGLLSVDSEHSYGVCAEERMAKYLLVRAIDDAVRTYGWSKKV